VRITTTEIRIGDAALPTAAMPAVARSPGVSSMIRWETAVSTEGTSW
jgi:hypothetical protein